VSGQGPGPPGVHGLAVGPERVFNNAGLGCQAVLEVRVGIAKIAKRAGKRVAAAVRVPAVVAGRIPAVMAVIRIRPGSIVVGVTRAARKRRREEQDTHGGQEPERMLRFHCYYLENLRFLQSYLNLNLFFT
jgi:hypothetical protein